MINDEGQEGKRQEMSPFDPQEAVQVQAQEKRRGLLGRVHLQASGQAQAKVRGRIDGDQQLEWQQQQRQQECLEKSQGEIASSFHKTERRRTHEH